MIEARSVAFRLNSAHALDADFYCLQDLRKNVIAGRK
jgi:hypothetical protein